MTVAKHLKKKKIKNKHTSYNAKLFIYKITFVTQ